jgi:hypothetical protein
MSESIGINVETKPAGDGAYSLIEFPRGDFDDYYYDRQIWMAVVHVRFQDSGYLTCRTL